MKRFTVAALAAGFVCIGNLAHACLPSDAELKRIEGMKQEAKKLNAEAGYEKFVVLQIGPLARGFNCSGMQIVEKGKDGSFLENIDAK